MTNLKLKWWLAAALLFCLVPSSFARKPEHKPDPPKCRPGMNCREVPEGGSAAIYLLGVGATCLGALLVRARSSRAGLS